MIENMRMATLAIRNFVYFTRNYPNPKKMCEEIWGLGVGSDHFYNKLKGYDFDMCRFFLELSLGNQGKLARWVTQNYDCGWNKYDDEEKNKPTCVLFGENASARYNEGGIDELMEHIDEDVYDVRKYDFTEGQKEAYFTGILEYDGWAGFTEITEEDYNKIVNREL